MPKRICKIKESSRLRLILIGGCICLAALILLYIACVFCMQRFITPVVYEDLKSKARLAAEILESSMSYLPGAAADWRGREGVYDYLNGEYEEFEEEFLSEKAYENNNLNALIVMDSLGRIRWRRHYDLRGEKFIENPLRFLIVYNELNEEAMRSLGAGSQDPAANNGISGFIGNGWDVYYFSSIPIVGEDGTAAGSYTFGRCINNDELAVITGGHPVGENGSWEYAIFSITPLEYILSKKDMNELLSEGTVAVTRFNEVVVYTVFEDIFGENRIVISQSSPRTLYYGIQKLALIMMFLTAFCLIAALFVFKKFALKK